MCINASSVGIGLVENMTTCYRKANIKRLHLAAVFLRMSTIQQSFNQKNYVLQHNLV